MANLIILIGEVWDGFRAASKVGDLELPGLKFVYQTIDRPIYGIIAEFIRDNEELEGWWVELFVGQVVIGLSSVFYGFLTFIVVGIVYFPFKKK